MWSARISSFSAVLFLTLSLSALGVENFTLEDGAGRFSFGYFDIINTDVTDSYMLEMPLERAQYKNIKIQTKEFHDYLLSCYTKCAFKKNKKPKYKISEKRASGQMMIADVEFDGELAVTFLVSKNRITKPADFIFTDKKFEREVKDFLRSTLSPTGRGQGEGAGEAVEGGF